MPEAKKYTKGDLTVLWDSKTCIHSANCVRGLKTVFNPKARPWVNLDGGTKEEIIDTINKCPSGALSYKLNDQMEESNENKTVELKTLADGPIMISGDFKLTDSEGKVIETREKVALCRCGASENKPFCDGAHKKVGFKG